MGEYNCCNYLQATCIWPQCLPSACSLPVTPRHTNAHTPTRPNANTPARPDAHLLPLLLACSAACWRCYGCASNVLLMNVPDYHAVRRVCTAASAEQASSKSMLCAACLDWAASYDSNTRIAPRLQDSTGLNRNGYSMSKNTKCRCFYLAGSGRLCKRGRLGTAGHGWGRLGPAEHRLERPASKCTHPLS